MADRIALRTPLTCPYPAAASHVCAELIRSVADKSATAARGIVVCIIAG
jgi:hypothetical protein